MGTNRLLEEYHEVYDSLEDQESKEIFINKLNYEVTGNKKFLKNIVQSYLPMFSDCGEEEDLYAKIKASHPSSAIMMYGAGDNARRSSAFWKKIPEFIGFCDRDELKQKCGMYGYPVISPNRLAEQSENTVFVISTSIYEEEAKQFLINMKIEEERIFCLKKYIVNYSNDIYFDKKLIQFQEKEIFIDAGTLDLSTSMELQRRCKNLEKVYAFEPDRKNYRKCMDIKKNNHLEYIDLYSCGLWSEKGTLCFNETGGTGSSITQNGNTVAAVDTIDNIITGDVTFIKMDIEGAELEALIGGKNTIKRCRPRLAISTYHKPEDLISIPLFVKKLVPEYKLYMRHYSTGMFDTVLYAI